MKKASICILLALCLLLSGCSSSSLLGQLGSLTAATKPSVQTTESVLKPVSGRMYYALLDKDEKELYDRIYNSISSFEEEFYVSEECDTDKSFRLLHYVLYDNPGIYWVDKSIVFSSDGTMTLKYNATPKAAKKLLDEIDKTAKQIIASLDMSGDDYDKALAIFEYLAKTISYAEDASGKGGSSPEYAVEGALLRHSAVCSGYTKAYQYLLSLVGIESTLIAGESNGANHAWLVMKLNGKEYFSDVTWGDQTDSETTSPYINHFYFAMTEEQLSADHRADEECELFTCDSTDCNYYVREGLYFKSYSLDELSSACKTAHDRLGKDYIEFFIDNEKEYKRALHDLVLNKRAGELGNAVLGKPCGSYVESTSGYLVFF